MRLKRSLADSGRPEIVFTSEITPGDYIAAFDRIDGLLPSAAILNLAPARGTSVKEEEHSFVECHAVRNHVAKVKESNPASRRPVSLRSDQLRQKRRYLRLTLRPAFSAPLFAATPRLEAVGIRVSLAGRAKTNKAGLLDR